MNKGWYVCSLGYDLGYSKLMHEIDGNIIGYLEGKGKILGTRVRDNGAGTGTIDIKLIKAGVKEVLAIENNPWMAWQIQRKRDKCEEWAQRISIRQDDFYRDFEEGTFDIELFRRCLYKSDEENRNILSRRFDKLAERGVMCIVHPEGEKGKYVSDGQEGIAPSHVLRWHIANIGSIFQEYQRYTSNELVNLCKDACPDANIVQLSPSRPAYNLIILEKVS